MHTTTLHPSILGATTTLQRIKRLTSHSGQARFLAECDDTPYCIARQADIPSPYFYSPTWIVYAYRAQYVVVCETAHKRYDVYSVPSSLLQSREDD